MGVTKAFVACIYKGNPFGPVTHRNSVSWNERLEPVVPNGGGGGGQLHDRGSSAPSVHVAHAQVAVAAPDGVASAAQDALEGVAELGAEDGVDDRVEHGVEVPEPEEEGDNVRGETTPVVDGEEDGHNEKRQPTDDKRAGNDG